MEVTNTTDEDAKLKVAGNTQGSGMAPHGHFDPEEAARWPTVPAGGRIQHKPNSPGPWTVFFFVQGQGVFKRVNANTQQVSLVKTGGGYRVDSN